MANKRRQKVCEITENEAVKEFEERLAIEDYKKDIPEYYNAMEMAISALEEVQQYRELGTVEELREAREKQRAKKPLLRLCGDCHRDCVDCDRYEDRCPNCNGGLYVECGKPHEYCPNCGQAIDWSEASD